MTDTYVTDASIIPQHIKPLNREQTKTLNAAEKAMKHIRQTFDQWLIVGRAFKELQEEAVLRSNSSKPSGRQYTVWYQALLETFLTSRPHLATVSPTIRSRAIWLFEHEDDIKAWRAQWTAEESWKRDAWNNPSTIKRYFELAQQGKGEPDSEETYTEISGAEALAEHFEHDDLDDDEDEEDPYSVAAKKRRSPPASCPHSHSRNPPS